MTQRSDRPLVGHGDVTTALYEAFQAAADGPRAVFLSGPAGSGRRTAMLKLLEKMREDEAAATIVRVASQPSDDGLRSLLRFYGSFISALVRPGGFDGNPVELLEEAASSADNDRIAAWLGAHAKNVRDLAAHGGGNFQIGLPQDNPWMSMLHAFDIVGPRSTWLVDLHDIGGISSPTFWTFLSALVGRARARNWKILFVMAPGENVYGEAPGDGKPGPLAFLYSLFPDATPIDARPLTTVEVAELLDDTYRPHAFPAGLASRLTELSGGRPDALHELLDALEEDETITWDDKGYALSDLEDVEPEVLVPIPQEDDDEDDDGDRDDDDDDDELKLDPGFMERVLHIASFEGRTFTSSLIRTYLSASEDAVDDALDAMSHIVEEGEYHQAMGTWTYKFRYAFYRDWYRSNGPEGWKEPAAKVCKDLATILLQSYAPASFEYIPVAGRLFVAAGENRAARNLLDLAMASDRFDLSLHALEIAQQFSDSPWPDGLLRHLHARTAERAVNAAGIEIAQETVEKTRVWATANDDPDTAAYVGLLETRILLREGKFEQARTRGLAALEVFEERKDGTRAGETLNHLAMVSLNMRDGASAQNFVTQAAKASTIPPVKAHSLYIEGLLAKGNNQARQALTAFTRSADLSLQSGNLLLSLEAMLHQGECALVLGQGATIAPQMERALEMSRALRSPQRERKAARLLCQAEAGRGQLEASYEMARHALELTRELKDEREEIDLYHCGRFGMLSGKLEEAVDFLTAAKAGSEKLGAEDLLIEVLFSQGQLRMLPGDTQDFVAGRGHLEQALNLVRERKDRGRELRILEQLGTLCSVSGDHQGAYDRYKEAMDKAQGAGGKELRRELHKRMNAEKALARSDGGESAASEAAQSADSADQSPPA